MSSNTFDLSSEKMRFLLILFLTHAASAFTGMTVLKANSPLTLHSRFSVHNVPLRGKGFTSIAMMQTPESNNFIQQSYSKLAQNAGLAVGDSAVFLLFAAIGRMSHSSTSGSVLTTAGPFILSWFLIAPLVGGFDNVDNRFQAFLRPVLPWALSVPLAIMIRGLLEGYVPAVSFWCVAMTATAVLMSLWRAAHFQIAAASTTVDKFVEAIVEDDE